MADQVEAVMGNVIWELEKFIGTGVKAPSFNGKKIGEVELELRCADDRTVSWLKQITPKLKPWRQAALKLLTKNEWEAICKPKRMFRMSVIVPWRTTGAYFMEILRSNNPGLRTKYWEIKNTQNWDDSTKFTLKIDEVSAEILRFNGYKVHWLLDVIEFRLERGKGAQKVVQEEKNSNGKRADGTGGGTSQTTTDSSMETERASSKGLSTRTGTSQSQTGNSEVQKPEEGEKAKTYTPPLENAAQ